MQGVLVGVCAQRLNQLAVALAARPPQFMFVASVKVRACAQEEQQIQCKACACLEQDTLSEHLDALGVFVFNALCKQFKYGTVDCFRQFLYIWVGMRQPLFAIATFPGRAKHKKVVDEG
jgi:hypothetical protein